MTKFRSALGRLKAASNVRLAAMTAVAAVAMGALVAGPAQAQTETTYDLTPAASGITDQITAVLTVVLPIAGGILALFIGWKMLKRFVAA